MNCITAKMYIEALKNNIRESLRYKREYDTYRNLAPIGYKRIRDKNNKIDIIVDTKQAPIIVELFNAYATGQYTVKKLTKLAHSLGLVNRHSKSVSESCICDMLENPFYYGEVCIMGINSPHNHQKLIDKSLFDTVQTIMKSQKDYK